MPQTPQNFRISRREFIRSLGLVCGATVLASIVEACTRVGLIPGNETTPTAFIETTPPMPTQTTTATPETTQPTTTELSPTSASTQTAGKSQIAFVKTNDRTNGVRRAIELLGLNPVNGKDVFLKPNYNSADAAPGSTHPDVLRSLVVMLREMGAKTITVGDRSGMGDTRRVMEKMGVFDLAQELGFSTLIFDELDPDDWTIFQPPDSHWVQGFPVARACLECQALVQACCLKTHRYGGHFTLSLKNSVGMVAKSVKGDHYNYMNELHSSPHQRRMIAEINAAYTPALIVMDGVEAFTTGGPDKGTRVLSEVVLAGTDRIAMDAVGVALLRFYGTTPEVRSGPIFQQEQIARAVELGLGVDRPERIEFLTDDPESATYAAKIQETLMSS